MPSPDELRRQFEQSVDQHAEGLFRVAARLTGSTDRASDLVQETFLQAWRGLAGLRDPGRLRAWLFGILHRQYLKQLRANRRIRTADAVELDGVIGLAGCATSEESEWLQRGLDQLDDEHRLPLLMHVMEELPVAEVARILELPEGTVMSRVFRARKKMQALLRPAN
jgi:RNA polymerase sigma-70 factor (ECF subfamily)